MNFGLLCNARRQHSAEALTNCQLGAFVFKLALFLIMHPHLHRKYVTEHIFPRLWKGAPASQVISVTLSPIITQQLYI